VTTALLAVLINRLDKKSLPDGIAAHIHDPSGMGKVIVVSCLHQVDKNTCQLPDLDQAADRVEINLKSGFGNPTFTIRAA